MAKAKYLGREFEITPGSTPDDVKDALSSLYPEILNSEITVDDSGNMEFKIRGGTKGEV